MLEKNLVRYFPIELTKIILSYCLKTVVLFFSGSDENRDHCVDIVCYKAMNYTEWDAIVQKVASEEERKYIHFNYDCREPCMEQLRVLRCTTVLESKNLCRVLELISPHHIGSDIDVFDAILHGQKFDDHDKNGRDEDDDDYEGPLTNEEIVKKLWLPELEQSHLKKLKLIYSDKIKVEESDEE
jgi:hypothetical protein